MRRRTNRLKGWLFGVLLAAGMLFILRWAFFSSGGKAEDVVDEFYQYEAKGDFSKSWTLFHSAMKEKFRKGDYIQDRAHVFMNHFGVETFTYSIGKPEKLDKWKMSKTGPDLMEVYKVPVTQTYKGKYGNFNLQQEVFVVKEKDEWRILWDYNQ